MMATATLPKAKSPGEAALEAYRAQRNHRKAELAAAKAARLTASGRRVGRNVEHTREIARKNDYVCFTLRQQGFTLDEIAAQSGLSRKTVQRALERTGKRLASRIERGLDSMRAIHTSQLESLVSELLREWERSKQPAQTDKVSGDVAAVIEAEIARSKPASKRSKQAAKALGLVTLDRTTKGQCGDPAYLQVAASLLRDIREIWGANCPASQVSQQGDTLKISVVYHESPLPASVIEPSYSLDPPAQPATDDLGDANDAADDDLGP